MKKQRSRPMRPILSVFVAAVLFLAQEALPAQEQATTNVCTPGSLAGDGASQTDSAQPIASGPWYRDMVPALPPVLSFAAFLVSIAAFRNTRRSERRRFMDSLMTEYQSPEMHLALETIFNLRDRFERSPKRMKKYYQSTLAADRQKLWRLSGNKRAEYLRNTLHYHRRVVSHFYQKMHWLIDKGGLRVEEVFDYWDANDTANLICRVLLPLDVDPKATLTDLVRKAGGTCPETRSH